MARSYEPKSCADCEVLFRPAGWSSVRCPDCQESHRRKLKREKDRRHRERNHEAILAKRRQRHAENRDEINRRRREWRKENPEDAKDRDRLARESRSEDQRRRRSEYHKSWCESNREMRREAARSYRDRNRERLNAYFREYHARNPEYSKASRAARKLREYAAIVDMSDQDREDTRAHRRAIQNDPCFYCGGRSEEMHDDHMQPLARGGTDHWWNLVRACAPCNLSKGAKTAGEFIEEMSLL